MNKPVKDWGLGIPNYTKDDVLEGMELHAFCTNIVAEQMQKEGYTIEGVILEHTPTQVIANKDGKRFFVIVAGDVYPHEGRVSFSTKRKFADFCLKQNVIPMFAPVSLMPKDLKRAEAGLALKYDGYYIKCPGPIDLSSLKEPTPETEEYKAYCVEKIIEAYSTKRFDGLYGFFSDDIQFHSQWVMEPIIGKKELIEYFDGKGKTLRDSDTRIGGSVVVINKSQKTSGNVTLVSKPGTVCALVWQRLNGKTNWMFISTKFDQDNKLCELCLNDPSLFSFIPYYAFQ